MKSLIITVFSSSQKLIDAFNIRDAMIQPPNTQN